MANRGSWDGDEDPGLMQKISVGYDKAWKTLIKPSRVQYTEESLGPSVYSGENGGALRREDFTIQNIKKQKLECSIFSPLDTRNNQLQTQPLRKSEVGTYQEPRTCIVYLHSHSGCRLEGLFLRDYCALHGYHLCLFDFAGCGLSDGKYVSLGHFEKRDALQVIEHVVRLCGIGRVVLWGRSMGAVTSVLIAERLAERRPGTDSPFFLSGLVLDSPFTRLTTMVEDVASNRINLPAIVTSLGMKIIKKTIIEKISFDVTRLEPINCVKKLYYPVAFILSQEDSMVPPKRIQEYLDSYGGKKKALYKAPGEHHSERLPEVLEQVYKFVEGIFDQEALSDTHKPRALWRMQASGQEGQTTSSGFQNAITVPLKERDGSTGLKNSSFFEDRDRNMSRDKQVLLEVSEKADLAAFFENISQKRERPAISQQDYQKVRIFDDEVEDANASKLQDRYNFIEKFIGTDKLTQIKQAQPIPSSSTLLKQRHSPLSRQFGYNQQIEPVKIQSISMQPYMQAQVQPPSAVLLSNNSEVYTVPLKGGPPKIKLASRINTFQGNQVGADDLPIPDENHVKLGDWKSSKYHLDSQLGVGFTREEFFMAPNDHNYKSLLSEKQAELSGLGGRTLGSVPTIDHTRDPQAHPDPPHERLRHKPEPSPPRESIGILQIFKREFVTPLIDMLKDQNTESN
jgi:esterase/lipase